MSDLQRLKQKLGKLPKKWNELFLGWCCWPDSPKSQLFFASCSDFNFAPWWTKCSVSCHCIPTFQSTLDEYYNFGFHTINVSLVHYQWLHNILFCWISASEHLFQDDTWKMGTFSPHRFKRKNTPSARALCNRTIGLLAIWLSVFIQLASWPHLGPVK